MTPPHTAVVGGGLAGAAVALALRQRGLPATVVDPGPAPGAASGAAAGMLAPQYEADPEDPGLEAALEAREAYPAFARRVETLSGRRVGHRRVGMLVVDLEEEDAVRSRRSAAWMARRGLRAEALGPGDAARRLPGLGPVRSALWLPDESQVDAQALAAALGPALEAAAAERVRASVRAVEARGGRVRGLRLADGSRLEAERVVLAAGAWSARIEGLPRPLPVRPVRGQMLRYEPAPPGLPCLVADHAGRYVVPRPDGSLLAGSTMEEAGFEARVTADGRRRIQRRAERLLPELEGRRPVEAWAGLRPVSADDLPILGPDPELEGLFYATGYGRSGVLLAPWAGGLVAAAVAEGAAPPALGPFLAGRPGSLQAPTQPR